MRRRKIFVAEDNQFLVNLSQLGLTVRTLNGLRQRAAEILRLAVDADPEWTIWGELGIPFAIGYWNGFAKDFYHQLTMMGEALELRVQALEVTQASYREADQAVVDALQGIHGLLNDEEVRTR
jgi:hypothetical protein